MAASHSSGKGADQKRWARLRKASARSRRPRAPRPIGRDEQDVAEEADGEDRGEGQPRRAADHPGDRQAPGEVGRHQPAAGRERQERRDGRDEAEGEVERGLGEGGEPALAHRGTSAAACGLGAGLGPGLGEQRADQAAGAVDGLGGRGADDADEVEEAEVGGEADAVAPVGTDDDLADEDVGRDRGRRRRS